MSERKELDIPIEKLSLKDEPTREHPKSKRNQSDAISSKGSFSENKALNPSSRGNLKESGYSGSGEKKDNKKENYGKFRSFLGNDIYKSLNKHKKTSQRSPQTGTPIAIPNPHTTIEDRRRAGSEKQTRRHRNKAPEKFSGSNESRNSEEAKEKEASRALLSNVSINDYRNLTIDTIRQEDAYVEGLEIQLLPHQVLGLKFLKERESVSCPFKGGLLCDDMGLGKTIQMIALMLVKKGSAECKTNLIICPVSLVNQWKKEIETRAPRLKVSVFHGINKLDSLSQAAEYDVMITTYATLCSEYYKKNSLLFSENTSWWRIILDEAHQIKNKRSKQTQAIFNLNSNRRWCLTGTPLQNNLSELQSLFKFVKVSKFSDDFAWETTIKTALRNNDLSDAIAELKDDLEKIMLRRTKTILNNSDKSFRLPSKRSHRILVDFSDYEKSLYYNVKDIVLSKVNRELQKSTSGRENNVATNGSRSSKFKDKQVKRSINYISALVYLLRLRQVCCSWTLISESGEANFDDDFKSRKNLSTVDELTSKIQNLSIDTQGCDLCLALLSDDNRDSENLKVCVSCLERIRFVRQRSYQKNIPTKFKEVLNILQKERMRKTIIFSQFSAVFETLRTYLSENGFEVVIYDGSMNMQKRSASLNEFTTNSNVTVLLCSLKCGSLGLNLTSASQVILFDPWWNPQIQEQATDRVYRIGQRSSVDIFQLVVKDTVEEDIMALQEKKRRLAMAITSDANIDKTIATVSKGEILQLLGVKLNT